MSQSAPPRHRLMPITVMPCARHVRHCTAFIASWPTNRTNLDSESSVSVTQCENRLRESHTGTCHERLCEIRWYFTTAVAYWFQMNHLSRVLSTLILTLHLFNQFWDSEALPLPYLKCQCTRWCNNFLFFFFASGEYLFWLILCVIFLHHTGNIYRGLIGPTLQFGTGSIYHPHLYAIVAGVFIPLPTSGNGVTPIHGPATSTRRSLLLVFHATGINDSSSFLVGFFRPWSFSYASCLSFLGAMDFEWFVFLLLVVLEEK